MSSATDPELPQEVVISVTDRLDPIADVTTGAHLEISGAVRSESSATASLTIQGGTPIMPIVPVTTTVSVSPPREVVEQARRIVQNEVGRISELLDRLDPDLIDSLCVVNRSVTEIGQRQLALEMKLGEVYELLFGQAQNAELVRSSLDQLSGSMDEISASVEQVLAAGHSVEELDLEPEKAKRWSAALVLYLAAAILASVALTFLLAAGQYGVPLIESIFAFGAGLVALYDRI